MNKRLRSILKYAFFFGLGVFLVWWQFHQMEPGEWQEFKKALAGARYWLVVPVIFIALFSYFFRALRWKTLIEPMGYHPSVFNLFSALMTGYLLNSFVFRVGEVVKCSLLGRYEKIPTEKLIGTILFERLFDLICFLSFIALTILIQFQLVGGFFKTRLEEFRQQNSGHVWLLKAGIVLAVLLLIFWIAQRIVRKYSENKHPVISRIQHFIAGLKEGVVTVKRMKGRRKFLIYTLLIWSMYVLQIYVGFLAIHELSHLGFGAACSVLTLATVAMIVMPGGLGAFPKAVSLILVLYSIDTPIGEAFGFVMWGVTTFITLFFGLLFFWLMIQRNKPGNTITASPL